MSIVIPAYYAHLAAARGKAMITHGTSSDSESTISGQSMSKPSFVSGISYTGFLPVLKPLRFLMYSLLVESKVWQQVEVMPVYSLAD